MKEYTLNSRKWGTLRIFLEKNYITIYTKVNERDYRFFRRTGPQRFEGPWEEKEVDWSGFIFGARSARFDFEWDGSEPTLEAIEPLIQKEYDEDGVYGFHVEPVTDYTKYENMTDAQLSRIETALHRRKAELESELRHINRQYNAVWSVGDSKYDWADRL